MLAAMFLHQITTNRALRKSAGAGLSAKMRSVLSTLFTMLMVLISNQASAQNITVTITANPPVICEGDLTTIFVSVSNNLPAGVSVSNYEYYFEDPPGSAPRIQATNTYSNLYAPGNYNPYVKVNFTNNTSVTSAPIAVTVYNKPVASFSIITQDTQCFLGNSVGFQNLSQRGATPSNPLATFVWVYGNGFFDSSSTLADQFHHYNAPGEFNVSLRAVDDKGCMKDTFLFSDSPVVILPPISPTFTWTQLSGPCFQSTYKFTNTTAYPLNQLKMFTWNFGSGQTYTARAPFSPTAVANYNSIQNTYYTNGQFSPSLILQTLAGDCIDSIVYTPANSPQALPLNIVFDFDVITTKSPTSLDIRDSVCVGSYNSGTICFNQTPIPFVSPGTGDFEWDFDDPASLQLNTDNKNWNPCHEFAGGMSTYFVKLSINNVCGPTPITHTYYAASTLDNDRYIDKIIYANNDSLDPNSSPQPYADTVIFPTHKRPLKVLTYANSYILSGGEYIGADTLYAYQEIGKRSPVYYISDDTILFSAPGVRRDTIIPPLAFKTTYNRLDSVLVDSVFFNDITNTYDTVKVDSTFMVLDTLYGGYNFYGYGARVIGPNAAIQNPQIPLVIQPYHLNQCGPSDTVDFVNASSGYKSRKVYRLWDFDDNFAPQCTSFTVPLAGYPPIVAVQPLDSITYDNGKTYMVYGPDTTRMWTDAIEQYQFSNHYFIANGQTYGGKVNCKYSYDSLPRHWYPNWDSLYRYYENGHDFMPWDSMRYGDGAGKIPIQPYDSMYWNKPVFLDPVTGKWSLTQGSGPDPYGPWVRIDTITWNYNNGTDLDVGHPITVTFLPDPFRQEVINNNGSYPIIGSATIEPTKSIAYRWMGKTYVINGSDILPDGHTTFYKYAFTRTISRCPTVRMNLKDSLNNESLGATANDSAQLDSTDCKMEASVQLPFAKADARGLAKKGKECPGGTPNGVFFQMSQYNQFPGLVPSCGQTFILFNYDSLADRLDGTPCDLDGFTSYKGGVTPGGLSNPEFFSGANFNGQTKWQNPSGTTIAYHYGLNAPANRPAPADVAQGWITVGIAIGSGCKDSLTRGVRLAEYRINQGAYEADISAPVIYNPGASPVPGLPTNYTYTFTQIKNIRPNPNIVNDTLIDIEYQDCNWAKCLSDTVWYHRFLRINNLTSAFEVEPTPNTCRLYHKGEEITVHYEDTIQDDIKFDVWQWGDNTLTVDSFYYLPDSFDVCIDSLVRDIPLTTFHNDPSYLNPITAPIPPDMQVQGGATTYVFSYSGLTNYRYNFNGSTFDTIVDIVYTDCVWSNGYYTNGVRRVRYNFDNDTGDPILLDSTVWPVRASGIGATDGLKPGESVVNVQRDNFNRIYTVLDRSIPDKIVVQAKCPPNKIDTMFVSDTMQYYPVVQTVDSALAFFPQKHTFKRTSWEVAGKVPGSTIGNIIHLIGTKDPQNCFQVSAYPVTIGYIDTFDILNSSGEYDTLFCENEPVFFRDSLRYFRFDCIVTDLPYFPAVSNSPSYAGILAPPYDDLQIDSADFWRQDVNDQRAIQQVITSVAYTQWDPFSGTYINTYVTDTVVPERVYWDYGDGSPIDSSVRPVHRYKNFGRYKVTMVSRDSLGYMDTCVGYVNISRPVAKIDFLRDGAGDPVQTFTCGVLAQYLDSSKMATAPGIPPANDSIKTNYWWFGDKTDTTMWWSTDNPAPGYRYRTNGTFKLKLVSETYQGCKDTAYDTIFISGPRPMIQLVAQADTVGCAPFRVKVMNLADSLGKQFDANGNPITDSVTKTTYIFWGDKNQSQTMVLGRRDTVEFTYDTAGVYYIYALGSDGANGSASTCDLVLYPDTPNMLPIKIDVIELGREVLINKDIVCVDNPFQISNNSDPRYSQYTYIYENAAGVAVDSTVKDQVAPYSFNYTIDSMDSYRIIARPDSVVGIPLTAVAQCKINDTLHVKVVGANAAFSVDSSQVPTFKMVNTDTVHNIKYEWAVNKVGSSAILFSYEGDNKNPHYQFDLEDDTGTYRVCLTAYAKGIDLSEACTDSVCHLVINAFTTNVEIPNVFSPDGDGKNDFFKIKIEGNTEYKLVIYNRWGAKVFESGNSEDIWNGKTFNEGAECPPGVYYYMFDYKLRGQESGKSNHGTVTLIR